MASRLEPVTTAAAPAAIGPYSQAIRAGDFVFLSGQIALRPEGGGSVGGSAADQTRQVLRNLAAVLEAAGGGLADVARCTVYLANLDDFPDVNEVYATFFPGTAPARATVEVSRLPKGALVEIDAIAHLMRP